MKMKKFGHAMSWEKFKADDNSNGRDNILKE